MEKQNNYKGINILVNKEQRSELLERLVSFVCHDTILYLPEEQMAKEYLSVANAFLDAHFEMCNEFVTKENNILQKNKIEKYLNKLSATKLTGIYLLATELRSVILGILLAEDKIGIEEAFACSFTEELAEQKKWGTLDEITQKHIEIKERLIRAKDVINA